MSDLFTIVLSFTIAKSLSSFPSPAPVLLNSKTAVSLAEGLQDEWGELGRASSFLGRNELREYWTCYYYHKSVVPNLSGFMGGKKDVI